MDPVHPDDPTLINGMSTIISAISFTEVGLLLKEGDIKYLDGKSKGSVELAGGLLQMPKAFCGRRLVLRPSSVA